MAIAPWGWAACELTCKPRTQTWQNNSTKAQERVLWCAVAEFCGICRCHISLGQGLRGGLQLYDGYSTEQHYKSKPLQFVQAFFQHKHREQCSCEDFQLVSHLLREKKHSLHKNNNIYSHPLTRWVRSIWAYRDQAWLWATSLPTPSLKLAPTLTQPLPKP